MTHIAVERNRRKQMNEYLSVLRSLMPESYVQRGDQASIIGGAINFVKELEQRLQLLGAQKETSEKSDGVEASSLPFSEFFTFPQYSTSSTRCENSVAAMNETMSAKQSTSVVDIEVTMVESHANLKIRSKRRPKQLLKVVSGLLTMRLTILHLNVTTLHQIVLYSLSVKVEDDCKLSSVDEIATAVYEMLGPPKDSYVVDDASVLSRVTKSDLRQLLSDLEARKNFKINFITVRKLTSKADAFEYADQILEKWYPTVEEGNNKGIVVLVTSQKEGAVTGGPGFVQAVGESVLDSTVSENLPVLATEEKYNEAVFSSAKRLVAAIDGLPDLGDPSSRTIRENPTSKPGKKQKRRGGSSLWWLEVFW
ncbi:hypothetical protein GH714_042240 [Hevea brasiliensis]|uniref:BHLH domain-containing protein n=1 Tax=Hevea brasiliensis TaxID=3981 RepID=A0A6A6MYJ0_HEVBR|nr:hypothetical protein GH714_042240 [Hevea brasiliensis]